MDLSEKLLLKTVIACVSFIFPRNAHPAQRSHRHRCLLSVDLHGFDASGAIGGFPEPPFSARAWSRDRAWTVDIFGAPIFANARLVIYCIYCMYI